MRCARIDLSNEPNCLSDANQTSQPLVKSGCWGVVDGSWGQRGLRLQRRLVRGGSVPRIEGVCGTSSGKRPDRRVASWELVNLVRGRLWEEA